MKSGEGVCVCLSVCLGEERALEGWVGLGREGKGLPGRQNCLNKSHPEVGVQLAH